jgi:hypothetical protein
MTADPEWDQAFAELARADVRVRLYLDDNGALHIHARESSLTPTCPVGSQNFSVARLERNRDLGIITHDPTVVKIAHSPA